MKKLREGSTGGGASASAAVVAARYPESSYSLGSSSTVRSGSGTAAAPPGMRGDSTESSAKCIPGTKDLGLTSFGYGGTSDCPDLVSTVTFVVATHTHLPVASR